MRQIHLTIASLLLASATLVSCDMDAPTQSSLNEQSTFSVYGLAEREVMSVCVSFGETNSYRGRFLPYYGISTDIEVPSGTTPSAKDASNEKQALYNYDTPANNPQMNTDNNAYAKFYEGIERANLAIQGIRKEGDIEHNADMRQLLGEALTLRAVLYLDLTKAWGDVPARFVPNSPNNVYLPRTNRDSIYIQLLNDLKEAEDYCYWPNQNAITKTTERVSKSFVKGLRARIALVAGGYGLRGDGFRRSNNPELAPEKMYAIAKEECEDVINSGRNKLGSFKDNFVKLCEDNVTAGGESLWEIPFSDGRGRVLYTFGIKHNAKDQYTGQAQGGVVGPTPTLYYDYNAKDIRRDITCIPYEWSKTLVEGKSNVQLRGLTKWCFGKLRYEWMKRNVTSTNDDGINWQYMRLADVYLMAAESENQLNGPSEGWKYMKPILDRALPTDTVAKLKAVYCASKEAFQKGIKEQRALEFAGESMRKMDLVRWGNIDEAMNLEKTKLRQLANREERYAGLPDKVYINNTTDANSIEYYGLNKGEDDPDVITKLKDAGWSSKNWFVDSSTGANILNDDYINGLFVVTPSTHCLWPIWQTFIDGSNGMINNNGNLGQLSN
uniref:RagB/SusD family nutrient uptake outer membrane protein n=1 Tax=Prevotella sp. TaxID=59823 RepID=UPI00402662EE